MTTSNTWLLEVTDYHSLQLDSQMDEMPQPIGFDEDGNPIFAEEMMGSEEGDMEESPDMHEMDSYGHEGSPDEVRFELILVAWRRNWPELRRRPCLCQHATA